MKASRCFAVTILALVVALGANSSAYALFPPPFFYPPVVDQGNPDPPTPPTTPDPFQPPPCDCCCHPSSCPPPVVASTPEPATLISGAVGLAMIGGYALRRRNRK